jgi:formate/nitrite transporter
MPNGPTGLDAYAPREMAARIETAGVAKAALPLVPLATLGGLAGVFIGFGAALFTTVTAGAEVTGVLRLLGGAAFALGLILVIVGGAELFTGNALMVMAWADGKVGHVALMRNWGVVLAANAAGALALVAMVWAAGLLEGAIGARAMAIAEAKLALPWGQAFWRGVLCNALVCLAVWLSFAGRSVTDKVLAVLWPVAGFVALGFEHSVANFYLIPAGILAGAAWDVASVAASLSAVILGNVAGGAGGVALAYRLAYSASAQAKPEDDR